MIQNIMIILFHSNLHFVYKIVFGKIINVSGGVMNHVSYRGPYVLINQYYHTFWHSLDLVSSTRVWSVYLFPRKWYESTLNNIDRSYESVIFFQDEVTREYEIPGRTFISFTFLFIFEQ